jgi:hypothetical protein
MVIRMAVSASLTTDDFVAEPGEPMVCEVVVGNLGQVVDHLTIDVVGELAEWASVEPPTLNLFPGEEDTVEIIFEIPRTAAVSAGEVPFGIRVRSQEDPDEPVVEEAVLTVTAFTELAAELLPRSARGRRSARYELAVDNRGNQPSRLQVFADDPDELLRFRLEPDAFESAGGTATFTRVRVKPGKTFFRGPNRTVPFRLHVAGEGQDPVDVDGTFLQEQLLPRWLLPTVAVAAVGLAAMLVLYFTVLKPTVTTAARDAATQAVQQAVAQQNAQLAPSLAAAQQKADDARQDAGRADQLAEVAAKAAGVDPSVISSIQNQPPAPNANGTEQGGGSTAGPLTDLRMQVSAAPGASATSTYAVPHDSALTLSDIILQNPQGDTGSLQLRRSGAVLLGVDLQNFRDLDYHFVKAIEFPPDSLVELVVTCQNPANPCTPAAYFTGNKLPRG